MYGQQLTVLTGDFGSGKTTIVTALVDELEGVSSALVTCPQHADSAEIRRKILVQLLSEPLFDDELPLPETLLDLADSLPTQCHIVLDDAHHLPLEIWAECIVLSQLALAGKSISLTLTTPFHFLSQLLTELPESQHQLLLPMTIEALSQVEREGLYYTLLQRSEQTPFTPREIVHQQLQQQQGLPGEVVKLLALALEGDDSHAVARSWLLPTLVSVVVLAIMVLGYSMIFPEPKTAQITPQPTVASVNATKANDAYAELLLAPYFEQRQAHVLPLVSKINQDAQLSVVQEASLDEHMADELDSPSTTENETVIQPELTELVAEEASVNEMQQSEQFQDTSANEAVELFAAEPSPTIEKSVSPVKTEPSNSELSSQPSPVRPTSGYVLQLASVKRPESLEPLIDKLASSDGIQIAKYRQRWILLFGFYETAAQARQEAKRLQQELSLPTPWLRNWTELSEYQLQHALPSS
nr:AAA family ATPase [Shewanella sp. Isolate11]